MLDTIIRTEHTLPEGHTIQIANPNGNIDAILRDTIDGVDHTLLDEIGSIPRHTWGGAMTPTGVCKIIQNKIKLANYSTIIALCRRLEKETEGYWNDNRERDFGGLSDTIQHRLRELGYQIDLYKTQHYMSNNGKMRLMIPIHFSKIIAQ